MLNFVDGGKRFGSIRSMIVTSEQARETLPVSIRREMDRLGWSAYKLSKESGVSQMTLSNILSGKNEPKAALLRTIADALGVGIDCLLPTSRKNRKNLDAVA